MHTVHSDGDWTVQGLAASAREAGLDFIFVTDHNTASHHAEVEEANAGSQQPLVMRGEEVTTYGGHANAWGLPAGAVIDFRVRPGDAAGMSRVAASAHRLGALISVNHPFALCGGCDWSYGDALKEFDAVEVWNGEWDGTDESALKTVGRTAATRPAPDGRRLERLAPRAEPHRAPDDARRGRTVVTGRAAELHPRRTCLPDAWGARALGRFRGGGGRDRLARRRRPAQRGRRRDSAARAGRRRLLRQSRRRAPRAPSRSSPAAVWSTRFNGPGSRTGFTEVFEVECERDGYYRLEVRDRDGKMFALTNPVYVKVGARR